MMNTRQLAALLAASVLSLAALSGCSGGQDASQDASQDAAFPYPVEGEGTVEGSFRPAETGILSQDSYQFPYMGLSAVLPQELRDKMDSLDVYMSSQEDVDDQNNLDYAFLRWSSLTQEQKDAQLSTGPDAFEEWMSGLTPVGTLGLYQAKWKDNLDQLTGCTQHTQLGQSSDGAYLYYLSTNPGAPAELTQLLAQIQTTLTDPLPFNGLSAFGEAREMPSSIGEFSTQDIDGNTVGSELFQNRKLTLVNVFTTWCTPCVEEIPALDQLHQELESQGIGVVGVVLDASNGDGTINQEALEKAKLLAQRTGASYPFLLPDETYMNGRIENLDAFPESFFVDQDGNIVSNAYLGSHTLEEWREIALQELAALEDQQ